MLKKTVIALSVATLAGAGALDVLPTASAKAATGVQLAACNPCAGKKKCGGCNPCRAKSKCGGCNPCRAKSKCGGCNPCAGKKKKW
ncbi:MAG: hypothetical protein HOB79_21765 [Rhodospirillaceae bacterium]|nr:hypothetical protein [Rhodospirillales bacterium]MBT3906787.1 hypothetical protein [Rhodospirillaceae bacterium]MBT4703708.1 hypothetical protein [Rhodospirillaceae bacterium]MBT5035849.1 hypothetical protein [Rhodospirillaceae bacterium]MBT6222003.1 hypothetical protein [Rhodospirillaceae bacterium]